MTGLLVALIVFPLIGAAAASVLPRRDAADGGGVVNGIVANAGEAFLLGAGICGTLLFIAGALGISLRWTLIALLIASMARLFAVRRSLFAERRSPITYDRAATIVLAVPLLVLAFDATIAPLNDFDGRVFWVLKAKGIADEQSIRGPLFHGGSAYDPRNQYPLLVPIDAAVVLTLARDLDDHQVRWFYLLLFIALALHLRERLARRFTPAIGAWCAALLVWIPQFAVAAEGGARSGYSDMAVAAFVAGAFLELAAAESPMRFALWLAFLPLTKNEGLVLAILLFVAGCAVFRRRIWPAALALVIAIASLVWWRLDVPPSNDENLVGDWRLILHRLDRVPIALGGMLRHMTTLASWGGFWIAVAVALALLAWRRDRLAILPATMLVAILGLYFGVYLATHWVVVDLINASFDRLLMHAIGPAMYVVAAGAKDGR